MMIPISTATAIFSLETLEASAFELLQAAPGDLQETLSPALYSELAYAHRLSLDGKKMPASRRTCMLEKLSRHEGLKALLAQSQSDASHTDRFDDSPKADAVLLNTQYPLRELEGGTYTLNLLRGRLPVDVRFFIDAKTAKRAEAASSREAMVHVLNMASMPTAVGVREMPDFHPGPSVPIGTVVAMEKDGLVSPPLIGGDIGCGVRLDTTHLLASQLSRNDRQAIVIAMKNAAQPVPHGVEWLREGIVGGMRWAVENGIAEEGDLKAVWNGSVLSEFDKKYLEEIYQFLGECCYTENMRRLLGTIGEGNHFVELQAVDTIFNGAAAAAFGIEPGQVMIAVHSGSRNFGGHIGRYFVNAMKKSGDFRSDAPFPSVPVQSEMGRRYMAAVRLAQNFAELNRHLLALKMRKVLAEVTQGRSVDPASQALVDVSHNTVTLERLPVGGEEKEFLVHRKGAAPARPSGDSQLPAQFREVGLPTPVPGDMGRASYIVVGGQNVYEGSFGSVSHGAGRLLSRTEANRLMTAADVRRQLDGIPVSKSHARLRDEAPHAYKNVDEVIGVLERAGLATPVLKVKPIAVVKEGKK